MQSLTAAQKRYLVVVLVGVSLFVAGYLSGARTPSTTADSNTLNIPLLSDVKELLDEKYISWKATSTLPTEKELEYGMIRGYVDAYKDPYTVFFPPREAKSFTENVKGSFGGVGMQVSEKDGRIVVIAPLKDSPAMKAGIKAGDTIVAVDKRDITGMSSDEAVSLIRGEIGTKVSITVLHKDAKQTDEITIVREEIKIPTIDTEVKSNVFIIRLYNFSSESAQMMDEKLREFANSGTPYLILDLRGNPGGYLDAAVNMASFFLPEGKPVVVEKRGKNEDDITHRSRGFDYFNDNLKMAVLLDGGSASASEILAGALKDHKIAKIVGEKSFGKGSVQELINLTDGSALKVTVAKWFTPNGTSISEHGITPDIETKLDTKLFDQGIDTQLEKAIETVKAD